MGTYYRAEQPVSCLVPVVYRESTKKSGGNFRLRTASTGFVNVTLWGKWLTGVHVSQEVLAGDAMDAVYEESFLPSVNQ